MKLWVKNTLLAVLLVVIVTVPLILLGGHEFGGSDGQASGTVSEIDPGYEPWFQSVWEPPSGEIESLLFCVQAAIGAGVVGFVLGRITKKNAD